MDVIPVQTQNMAVLNWLKISPIFCVFNLLVVFPNITTVLKIFATFTFAVSTATAERPFSTLRRLKTYLRTSMGSERLNGLMSISTEKLLE